MPLVERKNSETHPEGVFTGTLADIVYDDQGKYGPQILWKFDSHETMLDGRAFRLSFWTTPTLNEKSHLYALLKAFGEDPEDHKWEIEEISDLDELLGRKVQLNVIHKKTENGVVHRIDRVLALPKRREARPADPAPAAVRAPGARSQQGDIWADKD